MKKKLLLIITMMLNLVLVFSYDWKGRIVVGDCKEYSYQLKDHFDTFKYGDRNLLLERYPMLVKRAGWDFALEKDCEWYEFPFYKDIYVSSRNNNGILVISNEVGFEIINFIDKNKIVELDVKCDFFNGGLISDSWKMDSPNNGDIESVHKIILKFDGDFIYVYVNNMSQLFHVYCKMYEQDRIRFNKCMATNNFDDLSEVIWPHHADGTSEYEDTIRYPGEEVNNNSSNDSESNDEEFSQEFLDWLSGKEYETQEQSEDDLEEKNEEIYKIKKIQILFFFIIIIIFSIIIIKIIIQKNKKKRQ